MLIVLSILHALTSSLNFYKWKVLTEKAVDMELSSFLKKFMADEFGTDRILPCTKQSPRTLKSQHNTDSSNESSVAENKLVLMALSM